MEPPEEFRQAIVKGLEDGLALRFPAFLASSSIWIVEINADAVASSQFAFYRVARLIIEQAFSRVQLFQA